MIKKFMVFLSVFAVSGVYAVGMDTNDPSVNQFCNRPACPPDFPEVGGPMCGSTRIRQDSQVEIRVDVPLCY